MQRTSFFRSLALAGTVVFFGAGCSSPASPPAQPTNATTAQLEREGLEEQAVVRIDGSGYHPATVTIRKGQSVLWVNEDVGGNHWPASNPHPTHTDNPAFDPKQAIVPGSMWQFAFDKTGVWRYHDHLHPETQHGYAVTVIE